MVKRISNRKCLLNYHLILKNNGKTIVDTFQRRKCKILDLANSAQWQNGYLRVGYTKDLWNDSEWTTKEGLINALNAYTEKPLLDWIENK